jgi:hypothetical protein
VNVINKLENIRSLILSSIFWVGVAILELSEDDNSLIMILVLSVNLSGVNYQIQPPLSLRDFKVRASETEWWLYLVINTAQVNSQ